MLTLPFLLLLLLYHADAACTANCLTCAGDTCTSCQEGHYHTTSNPACSNTCRASCKTCTADSECQSCQDGYFSSSKYATCGRQCRSTCKTCTEWNACQTCKDGYYSSSSSATCGRQCRYKCKTCTGYNNCQTCKDGYYISEPTTPRCRSDCKSTCQTCTGYNTCESCKSGWSNYGSITDCSIECYTGCSGCSSNYVCTGCKPGYYSGGSSNPCSSMCSSNCETCTSASVCQSCNNGWSNYGSVTDCSIPCLSTCSGCSSNYVCTGCNSGRYGTNCDSECNSNCLDSCDIYTGNCHACHPGKYGDLCQSTCPGNCGTTACDKDTGACLTCPPTYYGSQCQYLCSPLCHDQLCDMNGVCSSCPDGKYGQFCNNDCPPANCAKCNQVNGACEGDCNVGYYGNNCESMCQRCESSCDKQTGVCGVCVEGFTGLDCIDRCASKCKGCYRFGAYTCNACSESRYGYINGQYTCNNVCSSQCLMAKCHVITGKCNECPEGYSSDQCNIQCNAKCKTCSQLDPSSCTACSDSTYGYKNNIYTCENQCPSNCKDGQCDDMTGDCSQGCIAGYAGKKCQCPENCNCDWADETICTSCKDGTQNTDNNCVCSTALCSDASCTTCSNSSYYGTGSGCCLCSQRCKDQKCDSREECKLGCENGFFKSDCSGTCTDIDQYCEICTYDQQSLYNACSKCDSYYYPNDVGICEICSNACLNLNCDSETGRCLEGCYDVHTWGDHCTLQCGNNCNGCEQSDGKCDACLTNTVHGDYCNSSCSAGCIDTECERTTGTCMKGCHVKYHGNKCDMECSDNCAAVESQVRRCSEDTGRCVECMAGFYGDTCTSECSNNCVKKTCAQDSGQCNHGCSDGFQQVGVTCSRAKAATEGAAIGGAIGAVVVIAIIVVVVFIFIRRRNAGKRMNGYEPRAKPSTMTMNDMDVKAESSGNVYNEPGDLDTANYQLPLKETIVQRNTESSTDVGLEPDADDGQYAQVNKPLAANGGPIANVDKGNTEYSNTGLVIQANAASATLTAEDNPYEDTNEDTYYNSPVEVNKSKIAVDKLAGFVEEKNPEYFKTEFEIFPADLIKPYVDSQTRANAAKNRYKGLYPYDDCRVKVAGGETDYINASYIDGYKKRQAYIASQGPMKKQMGDYSVFWMMIWQQDVEIIVMLTNLREDGTVKCEQYWPDIGSEKTYSDILVTSHTEDEYAEFVLRSFTLKKGSKQRTLHQLHYTAWPDKGTPDDVTGLVEFRQKVLNMPTKLTGPTLVHCRIMVAENLSEVLMNRLTVVENAGVGRTGTYIGLDILTKEGQAEKMVDIPGCVRNMRQNRIKMVQTWDQYQYLHNAVVHSLTFDCKPIQTETFQSYMANTEKSQLDTLYKKLCATTEKPTSEETQAITRNQRQQSRNRQGSDIPGDANRPRLFLGIQHGDNDYINAVFINSHRTQMRYLVAQSPLPGTVQDFLSLAYQQNCSCLVSFEAPGSDTNQDIGVYYPADNETLKQGKFSVSCSRNDTTNYSVQRKLNISYNGKEKVLPHLQFTDWDAGRNVPKSASNFLQFINEVETEARKSPDNGPVMIHCRDGAGKSGLFCVVAVLLQKIEIEHEVSIVNTVRQVKSRRRLAIPNKEQFHFCYGCIQEYLTSFDIYSNFVLKS